MRAIGLITGQIHNEDSIVEFTDDYCPWATVHRQYALDS